MIKGKKYSALLVALHGGRVELRRVVVKALYVVRLSWDPEAFLRAALLHLHVSVLYCVLHKEP